MQPKGSFILFMAQKTSIQLRAKAGRAFQGQNAMTGKMAGMKITAVVPVVGGCIARHLTGSGPPDKVQWELKPKSEKLKQCCNFTTNRDHQTFGVKATLNSSKLPQASLNKLKCNRIKASSQIKQGKISFKCVYCPFCIETAFMVPSKNGCLMTYSWPLNILF